MKTVEEMLAMPLGVTHIVQSAAMSSIAVVRVPGGWLYVTKVYGHSGVGAGCAFVPEPAHVGATIVNNQA